MPVIIDGTLGVNAAAVTTTSWNPTNLVIPGNSTIGDATSDTLTVNAGALNFAQSAQRITGDMSNATDSNRLAFQTNTVNGGTRVNIISNGTGTASSLDVFGVSDPTNAAVLRVRQSGTESQIQSTITGTGTYLPMTFYAGGSERLRISTAGNVSIGGTVAYAKLTLNSSTSSIVSIYGTGSNSAGVLANAGVGALHNSIVLGQYTDAGNYGHGFLSYGYYGDDGRDFSIGTSSGSDTANSTYLPTITFKPSGKVGIGTASPSSLLDIMSSGVAVSTIRSSSTTGSRGAKLRLNVPSAGGDDPAGAIEFTYNTDYTAAGSIIMTSTPNTMFFNIGTTERMRIDGSGNVGIGTSSPGSYGRFAVMTPTANYGFFGIANSAGGLGGVNMAQYYGTTKISYIDSTLANGTPGSETAFLAFATANSGTLAERMRITSDGIVSIGNTTPDNSTSGANTKLFVQGPTNGLLSTDVTGHTFATFAGAQYGTTQSNWGGGILLKPIVSRGASAFIGVVNADTNMEGIPHFVIRTGNYASNTTERLRIDGSGYVGVGTSSILTNLTVNGYMSQWGLAGGKSQRIAEAFSLSANTTRTVTLTLNDAVMELIDIRVTCYSGAGSGAANVAWMCGGHTGNDTVFNIQQLFKYQYGCIVVGNLTRNSGSLTFTMQNTHSVQGAQFMLLIDQVCANGLLTVSVS